MCYVFNIYGETGRKKAQEYPLEIAERLTLYCRPYNTSLHGLPSGGSRGGGHRGHVPPPPPPFGQPIGQDLASPRMYAYGSHAKTGAGSVRVYYCESIYEPMASASSQLLPASFLLHQSAELPKKTPFRLTKTCSCRMIPWASKRGRLALKRRFVLQITLESISESLSFKIFLGGMPPDPPTLCAPRGSFY